jgi:hypothetical protein
MASALDLKAELLCSKLVSILLIREGGLRFLGPLVSDGPANATAAATPRDISFNEEPGIL